MKNSPIVLSQIILKLILGAIIFLAGEVDRDRHAVASTLKIQRDNNYGLEGIGDFSLTFNRNLSSQLGQEILPQNSDFSDYVNLVTQKLNNNQDTFPAEVNILVKSSAEEEEKLLEYLLVSLSNIELQTSSNNSNYRASIPVLPQVNYRDVYRDIYDFDVSLAEASQRTASQIATPNRRSPGNVILMHSSPEYNYSTSYLQNSRNSLDYRLPNSEPRNISNINSSLLVSEQQNPSLSSLLSSPSANFPLIPNQSRPSFLPTSNANSNNYNYNQNYSNPSEANSQLREVKEAVYIPPTPIEAYQIEDFNVPSSLNGYQKPEHQESLEKTIQSEQKIVEKQRQNFYKSIQKLQKEREKALAKELEEYRKKRQKELQETIKKQKQLQKQRQQQFRL